MIDAVSESRTGFGVDMARSAVNQDEVVLERLYDEYAQSLYRFARSLTSSPEDAEDAVQEVFIRVARGIKGFHKIRCVKTYLFTATRNAAYSVLRSRMRRDTLIEAVGADLAVRSTVSTDSAVTQSAALSRAIEELPVDQREALVLKVFEQMTFSEIAQVIGVSSNTVASRYRYGIAKLRQALEVDDDER